LLYLIVKFEKLFVPVLLIGCLYQSVLAQEKTTAKPVTLTGNLQITNNGIAPVPIFALGRPAAIGTFVVKKGNFYFNPELYFGLDTKPWTINSRFGYNFIDNKNSHWVMPVTLVFSSSREML